MKKIYLLFLFCLLPLLSTTVLAQGNSTYQQATEAYEQGQFEQSDKLLLSCISQLNGEEKIGAYRMLALSSLYQDNNQAAEEYSALLLSIDPFYTAYGDSPRFIDILDRLKKGKNTITTASKIAESLEEVPVPVTLITEDMIKASGARTLTDVLLLYVPGVSLISGIEDNVAMRGVYSLSQESMLVMVDGHRVNSQSTNAQVLDFRNNLDKIKQIEVLRGPASSLYGNVALTAVVNIITKNGSDLEHAQLSAKVGNNNTYGGTFLFGNGNLKTDIMTWASVYSSIGEARTESGTTHYIGGYNNKPAFDLGAKIRWGDLKIEAMSQHAKNTPYYNLLGIGDQYSYDKYTKQRGEKPGMSRTNTRVDIDYSKTFGSAILSMAGFAAVERVQLYNVLGDEVNEMIAALLLQQLGLSGMLEPQTVGVWQALNWEVYSFGGSANITKPYTLGKSGMYGSIIGGVQYEMFSLSDASFKLGSEFNKINLTSNNMFYDGSERTTSAFVQLKHNFNKQLIFNGGLRFDHKTRFNDRVINTLSPRMSFIWLANKTFSIKGGFSHSFVDAPYFYRASQVSLFSGGSDLSAEKMDAFQVGATFNLEPLHLKYEVNTFYNMVKGLVYYTSSSNSATFSNSGNINMGGIENTINYSTANTLANLNFTYQYPFNVENYSSTKHNVSNVPKFLLNATATQKVLDVKKAGSLWIRANIHVLSAITCLDNDIIKKSMNPNTLLTCEQDATAIVGAGAEWRFLHNKATLSVDTYNLLDSQYKIGGYVQDGVPGQGFSIITKGAICF